jgi:hypothetical protein
MGKAHSVLVTASLLPQRLLLRQNSVTAHAHQSWLADLRLTTEIKWPKSTVRARPGGRSSGISSQSSTTPYPTQLDWTEA